jgi:hypothetical protein
MGKGWQVSGYIKLYRGWRDTDGLSVGGQFSDCEAWLWLLENCAWKDATRWNGKGEEIRIKPGQIHVSLRSLSTAWGWREGRVRRFLKRLENVQKATQLPAQSGTVLSIVNWAKYQGGDTVGGTVSDTAATQPRHTQEEGKERKEEKNNGNGYFFAGRVIRLNKADYDRWQSVYPLVDLASALQSRDDWLSGQDAAAQKKWFGSTSSWLANKHQALLTGAREAAHEPQWI